jgi:hypothetical protein
MSHMDFRLGTPTTASQYDEPAVEALVDQIRQIGLARFVGRINAGVIDVDQGYRAVERFAAQEGRRPLLSALGRALVGRSDDTHY